MNETFVTLQGWLGGEVTRRSAGGTPVANFRVGCTPRRFQRRTGEWANAETQWYTVTAWRALADNCAGSLRRGDPVVVHGRLNAQTWEDERGVQRTTFEVEATFVGHDLNRGCSAFARTPKAVDRSRPEVTQAVVAAQTAAGFEATYEGFVSDLDRDQPATTAGSAPESGEEATEELTEEPMAADVPAA